MNGYAVECGQIRATRPETYGQSCSEMTRRERTGKQGDGAEARRGSPGGIKEERSMSRATRAPSS